MGSKKHDHASISKAVTSRDGAKQHHGVAGDVAEGLGGLQAVLAPSLVVPRQPALAVAHNVDNCHVARAVFACGNTVSLR